MKILIFLWIFLMVFPILFFLVAMFIENNFDETHPFMKWWRKHVVAKYPEDDIYK